MAGWMRITHKQSGESQIVRTTAGIDLRQYDVLQLQGEPGEFHDVDVQGKLTENQNKKTQAEARVKLASLSRDGLLDYLLTLEKRIVTLESVKGK